MQNRPRHATVTARCWSHEEDDDYIAVIGLPLASKPGRHFLKVTDPQGKSLSLGFQVTDKAYEEQHITIKDKRKVNPEKRDMERITRESKQIKSGITPLVAPGETWSLIPSNR